MARVRKSLAIHDRYAKPIEGKTMKKILSNGIYDAIMKETNKSDKVQSLIRYDISDEYKYILIAEKCYGNMYFIYPEKV